MTRKQAILLGISILSKNKKNNEIVEKLQEILDEYPYKKWTKAAVFDAVEQYRIEHNGRYPNACDFRLNGLPSHPSIKNLFNMTVVEFLDYYYPDRSVISHTRFNSQSPFYWMKQFKETYILINNGRHVTQEIYDQSMEKGSPCAQTLIKMFNAGTYKNLIHMAGLDGKQISVKVTHAD